MSYNAKVRKEQDPDRIVVASGGSIDVESGGEIDIESGGALKIAGSQVTASASELNQNDISAVGAGKKYQVGALAIHADTNAHDSTIVLPAKAIITGVYLDITTQEATGATKTVDIGVSSGDEDGFLDGVSVASAGVVKGTLASAGQTLGALLRVDEDGAGALVPESDISSGGATICYTLGSNDFAELVGNIIVEYIEVV
jgi:hypothetical protein